MRSGDFKETYGDLVALTDSKPVWLWSLLLVAALIVAPYLLNSYALSFLTIILITAVGALGLNVLTGYTGLISLGHVGFLVTGAYAYAVVVSKYGMPPLIGFLAAGIVPALASLLVGAPSLRLKGLYLAITTLAFSFIINTVILEARTLTNGARGISVQRPEIFGVNFDSDAAFTHLRESVRLDDNLEYIEPWAWMHPPRHALAALLMEQGHFDEAEEIYRDDLGLSRRIQRCAQHPDNVWALHGLVECLLRRGEKVELPAVQTKLATALEFADISITSSCMCRGQSQPPISCCH